MTEHSSKHAATSGEQLARERLVEDLERRIEELEALDDSAIGAFTAVDWLLCIAGSILLPAIALWWFAG